MTGLAQAQGVVVMLLGVLGLALELYAFVHCVRQRPDAFLAAGKRSKGFWLAVTGVAALLGFAVLGPGSLGMLSMLAVVAAGVYLADVKPAVDQVMGRRGGTRW